MNYPARIRDHHQQFCAVERWTLVRDAKGKAVAHHVTYELSLFDGRILRTRISRPVDRSTYGKSMWSAILRDQLAVDAPTFWACVQQAKLPERGGPQVPIDALPISLVNALKAALGLSEVKIAQLTKQAALELLSAYWSHGG